MSAAMAATALRYTPGRAVAVFVAIFLGAALVVACGGLLETGTAASVPPRELGAAAVVVTADTDLDGHDPAERIRVDDTLLGTIRSVPGVAVAVATYSFPAIAPAAGPAGPAGAGWAPVIGHGWESAALAPYELTAGTAPSAPDEIVMVPPSARRARAVPGRRVEIDVRGTSASYLLSGLVAGPGTGEGGDVPGDTGAVGTGRGPAVFFAEPTEPGGVPTPEGGWTLRGITGPGSAATEPLDVTAGTLDELRDGTVALPADTAEKIHRGVGDRVGVLFGDGERADLRVVALFEGGTEVGSRRDTILLALRVAGAEVREFGLVRLTGATRGQVLRVAAAEGTVVGLVGLVLGSAASLITIVPFSLAKQDSLVPSGSPWMYVAVVAGAALLTVAATVLPAWHVTRPRPVDAIRAAGA